MAVVIKRYRVRHNGIKYGPGQPGGTILTGLSEADEARLINESNGSIEKYLEFKIEKELPAEVPKQDKTPEEKKNSEADGQEGQTEEQTNSDVNDILSINPNDLIKPSKKGGKK